MNINPLEAADKAIAFVDDSFESREEAETTRTKRQEIDLTSPFKLPHLIRPLLAIWGALNYSTAEFILLYQGLISPLEAMAANAAIVMAIIGFYFNSRKAEKVVAKQMSGDLEITMLKAKTAVKIEAIRAKVELTDRNKRNRLERRRLRKEQRDKLKTP